MRKLLVLALPLVALSACTVGPDYERPEITGEVGEWSQGDIDSAAPDVEAWRELGDPVLARLVEEAVAANLDIAQAEARLRQARAGLDAAAGGRVPEVAANASATRQRLSENGQLPVGSLPGFAPEYSLFDAGFDASWELDLWGGTKRGIEAARYRLGAADALAAESRLRVVAETVRAYVQLREAQAEGELARRDVSARETIARLARQSYEAGEIARGPAADADAALSAARARVPAAEAKAVAAANALAVLTGKPPEGTADLLDEPAPVPTPPRAVRAGLRADVLRRRPDVIAAEYQLAAATADVGVQTAQLFPKISLLGSIGQQARSVGDLASGDSLRFTVGPTLAWPIFAGGRIRAQIRAADARADEAAATYEQAVLSALADSETALNRYNAARAAWAALETARADAATSVEMARQRYEAGEDSLIAFNRARLAYDEAERAALSAKAQAIDAHAAAIKALGGGWSYPEEGASG
ncbi:efflux transporter outer membrane subunit [Croceicoccus pelagius]|uniref:RND transporter n=1 Tax=Croceicoccus pelagius TaxID=1703341 RepID=A0A916YL57_9SPHN|nr:efflux transporter outer membrane subunit [Croceicoccus pelagius]GGD50662.1 RND transporter [Croceicoccus pelagius]